MVSTRQQQQSQHPPQRQLVVPTSHIPWSVDVVHAMPRRLVELASKAVEGNAAAGWAAFTTGDGYVYAWQCTTKSLDENLEPAMSYVKMYLPELTVENGDEIHLALSASQGDAVHLYAYCQGWLWLRKLTSKDLNQHHRVQSHHAKTKIDFYSMNDDQEQVTGLQASPGLLVLSTNQGNLFWVTVTSVPVGLHVQKVQAETGFFSRLVFGSGTENNWHCENYVLPLNSTEFIALSQKGHMVQWKATITAGTAHHASFSVLAKGKLDMSSILSKGTILQATLSVDKESIYCIVRGISEGIEKLFWVQVCRFEGTIQRSEWINRFAEPSQVQNLGMMAMENQSVYAAFSHSNNILVMALLPEEEMIPELDLPPSAGPALLPHMLERDTTTHGCSVMTTFGLGLRVRYLPRDFQYAKKARYSSLSTTSSTQAPVMNPALISHLRSAFWQAYQDPATKRPLPPSLPSASAQALEMAVVNFAMELQQKNNHENPMEWHCAFVKFLQERGLYRRLSTTAKWQLLSMGQELAAFGYVVQFGHQHEDDCRAHDLAEWLLKHQEPQSSQWNAILAGLVQVAMQYREDKATAFYDVLHEPTIPLWLSHGSLQQVLKTQLQEWQDRNVPRNLAEPIATAALLSYLEHHPDKREYDQIQRMAISLLRSLNTDETEELAFELCIKCKYFEGLCEMSIDHEKKRDSANFSLDPLFESMQAKDVLTGYTFPQYVLQWHTDRGLYGHAINYGRQAPNDLALLMKHDEQLRKYKWIPAVQQGYFERATESCLDNAKNTTMSLKEQQFALSMAKLSNMLCVNQDKTRQKLIDGKLDLVKAQQMLEGDDESAATKTPVELVRIAIHKLQTAVSLEDRVRFATIALAVCNAMEDTATSIDYTAQVWAETLKLDEPLWDNWIKTESDLTNESLKERMMDSTVFGALLEECRIAEFSTMSKVMYGRHIESAVLDKLGSSNPLEFSRLLRSLTANPDAMQGQSLIAAAY